MEPSHSTSVTIATSEASSPHCNDSPTLKAATLSSRELSSAPSPVVVTKLHALLKWILPVAGFALSVYSLSIGIDRFEADAYCRKPLAVYLVVSACLGLIECLVLCIRLLVTSNEKSRVFRVLLLTSLVFFIVSIAWTILGAAWVWSINSDQCDSELYSSAQSVAIVNIVICALVSLSIAVSIRQKLHSSQQEPTADSAKLPV